MSGDASLHNVCEWVEDLKVKLKTMYDVASGKEAQAKETMKKNHDVHSKSRVLEEGSLALIRISDQGGKLSDVWDGPYEIVRKVTPVTYELAIPNKRKNRVIAYINRLKKWHSPEAIALRVVVHSRRGGRSNLGNFTGCSQYRQ